jgi:LPXTG-motif cell wall-anchored protein
MVGALLVASVWFGSAAHAGSYTPPSSEVPQAQAANQVQDPATVGSGSLPQTGSDTTETLVRLGITLVAVGGALAFIARRRSTASQH